jgi:RNA polymerase sigma-70 factor (ECF subfamily)
LGLQQVSQSVPLWAAERQVVAGLYTAERDGVYRYLLSNGVSSAQAQDVTQEAFLRLYSALRDGVVIENPKGWIYRVAHNLAIDSLVRERRNTEISVAVAASLASLEDNERNLVEKDWLKNFYRAVGQLSRQQRQCLELRARGLQYSEIAAVLKIRTSTVGEFLRRGIRQLKQWNQCQR